MIQTITVRNSKGDSLEMELTHPEKTGFLIYNVEGIGGATSNINVTDGAIKDGGYYNSSRMTTRNITISIKLMELKEPPQSVEDSRHLMYKYFQVKDNIRLTFKTDRRVVYIDGYVESNETPIFTNQEYAQISIICPDPHFYSENDLEYEFGLADPLFEFPFCDDSVVMVEAPSEYWQDNLIENFDFEHPINPSGEEYFRHDGETIKGWFMDVGMLGNSVLSFSDNFARFRQYESNEEPIRWYTELPELQKGEYYTATYIENGELFTDTFVWMREGTDAYEQELTNLVENSYVKLIADSESPVRLEFGIDPLVNLHRDIKAVKVEKGEVQSLAKLVDGVWVLVEKPVPIPPPEVVNHPTLQFGIPGEYNRLVVVHDGDVGTGMRIRFYINNADITYLRFSNANTRESFQINISRIGGVVQGDIIEISTYTGKKTVSRIRGNSVSNIVGGVDKNFNWFQLSPGMNTFEYSTDGGQGAVDVFILTNGSYSGV